MRSELVRLGFDADSPEVLSDRRFRGIVLGCATTNVFLVAGQRPALSIHGGTRLDAGQLGRGDAYLSLLSLLLVEEQTLRQWSHRLLPDFLDEPDFDPGALNWTGRVAKEAFHVDLGAFFSLPAADADYVVRAVLGPWSSNALRIRVRVER